MSTVSAALGTLRTIMERVVIFVNEFSFTAGQKFKRLGKGTMYLGSYMLSSDGAFERHLRLPTRDKIRLEAK
jgi:hypothetical protein